MNDRDLTYLEDMLSYGRDAVELLGDRGTAQLSEDKRTAYAVLRAVEIVGEAASKVSAEGRAELPLAPWRDIVGMRNVIVHGYRTVAYAVLVEVVHTHLPPLIMELERRLGETDQR